VSLYGKKRILFLKRCHFLHGTGAMKTTLKLATACLALGISADLASAKNKIDHVLLISVDGLHASDLARYVSPYPKSASATISQRRGISNPA
jgi:hypothetical protein